MNNKNGEKYKYLGKYTTDLTLLAEKGHLDPVIGRDEEIRRTMQVLQRRTKNNPVLIGKPGVGKTAIIEGLAQRIINKTVPDSLRNRSILSLDVAALIAGAKYRGEFEERFKNILNELYKNRDKIILFIDELHIIVGVGKIDGAIDASNMLKPSLARGELHCVGATTLEEYSGYIEKDAALERRFQKVFINELNIEDTVAVLRGLKERYELHHNVQITDSAIIAAVTLANRYISDRQLPDKAIDLIDEAASSIRIQIDSKPEILDRLERKIIQLKLEQQVLKKESDRSSAKRLSSISEKLSKKELEYTTLEKIWIKEKESLSEIQSLKTEIDKARVLLNQARRYSDLALMSELQYGKLPELEKKLTSIVSNSKNVKLLKNRVTDIEIADVLARWTGIPLAKIVEEEQSRLINMEQELHKRIVGQNEAIAMISNAIRRNRSGLSDPNKPIGSFLFLGPTGVGKTELCKALADFMFNDDRYMIRFDMSEFMEKHSVSRLLGAPPGYIGYENGGDLTEAIRRNPYSVILLDEIEKAHRDIFNILLQVLDDGRLTDSHGRTINFKNSLIIMTSNLGSNIIQERFNKIDYPQMKHLVMSIVERNFLPEFINRIDELVVFHPLSSEHIVSITKIQLNRICQRIEEKGYKLHIYDEVPEFLGNKGYNLKYGARPLKRAIQQELENKLAYKILSGEFILEKSIKIRISHDKKNIEIFQ